MNEIYWITRLDSIIVLLVIISMVSTVVAFLLASRRSIKWIIISIIAVIALVFIPSTKEALLIYGLGGAIDYLKEDNKHKELSDKCYEALNKFLETKL